MNIGIDIRTLATAEPSGVGRYLYGALEAMLATDKHNQYYLFSAGKNSKNQIAALPWRQDNVHYYHYEISNRILNMSQLSPWPADIIVKIPAQLDLFWLPHVNFFHSRSRVPLVLTIHDVSFLHYRNFYSRKMRFWHSLLGLPRLIRQAARIMVDSDNTKRDLVKWFSDSAHKISVINPGINIQIPSDSEVQVITHKLSLPEKYFLFLGTLEPRKNIQSLLLAFDDFHKKFPAYQLLIAGQKGWLYHSILGAISRRPYVRYLSYVSEKEKSVLYSRSQALVWPSYYEGYGYPPLEAMYFRTPVVTSYKTAMPEILKNNVIYIDPYNAADLSAAMIMLATDQVLLSQLRSAAANFAWPRWSDQAAQILKLFSEIHVHENSH